MIAIRVLGTALAIFTMIFTGCEPPANGQAGKSPPDEETRMVMIGDSPPDASDHEADPGVPFISVDEDGHTADQAAVSMMDTAEELSPQEDSDDATDADDADGVEPEPPHPNSDPDLPHSGPADGAPPVDSDGDGVEPVEPEDGDCVITDECPVGLVCSVEFGDCLLRADEEVCYGFCIPLDGNDPDWPHEAEPEDPCVANPADCADQPNDGLPGDELEDHEPPPGCGEGEDPCEANFQACMEAIENAEGVMGDIDEDWCAEELNECRVLGLGQDELCGDGAVGDLEQMCQEQLDVCLAGLDEENEIDRELIAFCYEAVEMCKDPPNGPLDDLAADHPMNDRCEVEFQACIDAHDPGPDASVEEIDDVFLACDEAFMVCIDAPLEDHEDAVPDQADDG